MRDYREYRFFSPLLDAPAARLSTTDDRGREYYAIIEAGYGKRWRELRNTALDTIEDAIEAGLPPGEINA